MGLRKIGHLSVLYLQGSPGEMGLEHGRVVADAIASALEHYVYKSASSYGVPTNWIVNEAKRCLPFIPPEYVEEMRGIAEGSGASFAEILALNCLGDVDGVYTQKALQCCNFVLASPATTDDLFLHGRNLDFPTAGGVATAISLVAVRTPLGSVVPTASLSVAGFVGAFTCYSKLRLTCGEVTAPERHPSIEGMPLAMLMRRGLERCADIQQFYQLMRESPRTCGYNLAVSDGKTKRCAGIETTHRLCEIRLPENGALIVDNVSFCKRTADMRLTYAAGVFRYSRMVELIKKNFGNISLDTALSFLSDTYDMAQGREGDSYNCLCNFHTVHSVLFLPSEDRMLVSQGPAPAPKGTYVELTARELWGGTAI